MARAATVPLVRNATLYAWLADREQPRGGRWRHTAAGRRHAVLGRFA